VKHKSIKIFFIVLAFLLLSFLPALAYPLTSPNYQVQTGVADIGGGNDVNSANFQVDCDSLGQPAVVGESTSTNFKVQNGFCPASTALGKPTPPPGVIPQFPTKLVAFLVGVLAFGSYLWLRVWKKNKLKNKEA
jgi:hypothetical protein